MKNILFSLIVLLSISTINGQNCNYTFSGIVEDFHDKTPIVDATVYIKNQNKYAVTDSEGKFSINNVCEGNIIVEVAHLACDTQVLELTINKNLYKIIDLEHHTEELNEVKVKGHVASEKQAAQITSIKSKSIEKYSSNSLGDALKEISGVSSLNTGNAIVKPVINGLHSSRILIMNNGVRLQDQEWGIEHAPNIDVNSAERILVVKGANALEFGGDAIGGVVVVNPSRVIVKDTLFGKTIFTQQTNGLGASITSSLNKSFSDGWFVNGTATYKRFGDAKAKDYYLTNTGLQNKAFSINSGFKNFEKGFEVFYSYIDSKIGILSASHLGSVSDLGNAIDSDVPLIIKDFSFDINNPKQNVTHHVAKALFYKRFKGLGKLDIQYDYQNNKRFEFDQRRGKNKFKPAVDLTLQTHSVSTNFKFDANKDRTYKVGLLTRYQNNFANPDTGVRRLIPDYDKYDAGVYAIANYTLNDFIINTGIRYDFSHVNAEKFYFESRWKDLGYDKDFANFFVEEATASQYLTNPTFTYHNISASAGATYKFNEENSLIFNYGLSNRAPNPSELFSDGLHHSAARIELGDLRVKPENSHRFGITYQYNTPTFSAILEGFFNHINDFIYIEPTDVEQTNRGAYPAYSYKQTNANMLGIDATINYTISKNWLFKNQSSYIYGQDEKNNRPLIDIPPFKTTNSLQYTNEKWYNFTSVLTSEFVGKQTRYPNNNFEYYDVVTDSRKMLDVSSTPEAYHLLNFTSSADFKLSKTQLTLGFSIDNLLNTSYREYLNRLRFFADDVGRNFKIQLKITY